MTEKTKELKFDKQPEPANVNATSANDEATAAKKNSVLGERSLKRGDSGEDVKALQNRLGVEPTGHFNEETETKVNYLRRVLNLKGSDSVDADFVKLIK